ncbi:MAG: hypothetical protein R3B40_28915 [Polyangiales bacterium]|nr:hypothetical protein [Sandaracinaceae bacterium]
MTSRTPMEREDEHTHAAPDDRFWNESYYFNFFDERAELGAAMRIGFSPNRGHMDGFVCFYFATGEVGFVRLHAPLERDAFGSDVSRVAIGALSFEMLRPYDRWVLRYDGPIFVSADGAEFGDLMQAACVDLPRRQVRFTLTADSLHPPYDFHASSRKRPVARRALWQTMAQPGRLMRLGLALRAARALPSMAGAAHYEQATRVHGEVFVDGVRAEVSGSGQRDHSWGVRDMRVPRRWRWVSFQFGADLCVNATRVEVLSLVVDGGYAFYGGRSQPLDSFELSPDAGARGRWPARSTLTLGIGGERHVVDVTVLRQLPVAIETDGHGSLVNEALARFHWRGRTTLGIVEAMEQRLV